jgi:hypothetical protein
MSASFLQNMPTVAVPFPYVPVSGSKPLGNGTHYYIMAFGKLSPGEEVFTNTSFNETSPIPKNYCQFWMEEFDNEKNKYVRWLYTGSNDPVHALGIDTKNQDLNRLRQIYGEKASKFPVAQPEVEFVLPVFKVNKTGKTYDLANGEAQLLIVRRNMMDSIVAAAKIFQDEEDAGIFGRVLVLEKNLADNDPKAKYKFSITTGKPIDLSSREAEITAMRDKAVRDIEKVFNEANGGSYDPNNVWGYLTTHFGGSREQLVAKYSVKNGANVSFENIEEVDI